MEHQPRVGSKAISSASIRDTAEKALHIQKGQLRLAHRSKAITALQAAMAAENIHGRTLKAMISEIARHGAFGLKAIVQPAKEELKGVFYASLELAQRRSHELADDDLVPHSITRAPYDRRTLASFGTVAIDLDKVAKGSKLPQIITEEDLGEYEIFGIQAIQALEGGPTVEASLESRSEPRVDATTDTRGSDDDDKMHHEVEERIHKIAESIGITAAPASHLAHQAEVELGFTSTRNEFQTRQLLALRRIGRQHAARRDDMVTRVFWRGHTIARVPTTPPEAEDEYQALPAIDKPILTLEGSTELLEEQEIGNARTSAEWLLEALDVAVAQTGNRLGEMLEDMRKHGDTIKPERITTGIWSIKTREGQQIIAVTRRDQLEAMNDEVSRLAPDSATFRAAYAAIKERGEEIDWPSRTQEVYAILRQERETLFCSSTEHQMVLRARRERQDLRDLMVTANRNNAEEATMRTLLSKLNPNLAAAYISFRDVQREGGSSVESLGKLADELQRRGLRLDDDTVEILGIKAWEGAEPKRKGRAREKANTTHKGREKPSRKAEPRTRKDRKSLHV